MPFEDDGLGFGDCSCDFCNPDTVDEQGFDWATGQQQVEERDYLVTAILQVVVKAENRAEAHVIVKNDLVDYIARSRYPNDPMNGAVVENIEDVSPDAIDDVDGADPVGYYDFGEECPF